jgi:hypothetical protein
MTLYPILKHDHQFDTWNLETKAVANTQGLSYVLDPKYAPTAIGAIALFKEQKIFMFAVVNKIRLTDQEKKIVCAHEIDSDAQVIYEEMRDYSLESTRSSLEASKLLTHFTLSRIDNRHWRGTTHGYLLHWQDQVRQYHTMVPKSDCFHDNQLRTSTDGLPVLLSGNLCLAVVGSSGKEGLITQIIDEPSNKRVSSQIQ